MQNLVTFIGLIDPFTPINLYTALLPIHQLWTVDLGIKEINTFFKTGPLLLSHDVPPFDASKAVIYDYRLDYEDAAPQTTGKIGVPSVGLWDWAWLQSYW